MQLGLGDEPPSEPRSGTREEEISATQRPEAHRIGRSAGQVGFGLDGEFIRVGQPLSDAGPRLTEISGRQEPSRHRTSPVAQGRIIRHFSVFD